MAKRHKRKFKRRPSGQRRGNYPIGKIELNHAGYGFVDTDEGSFFIGRNHTHGAMPGDTVEVRPHKGEAGTGRKRTASVLRVLEHAMQYLVGILEVNDPIAVVVAQDPRIHHDLFVCQGGVPAGVESGDVVLAKITEYPARHIPMQGYVIESLGHADAPGIDVDIIVHNAGLPTQFSAAALEQAAAIEPAIEQALAERGRRDLRMRDVFTIDPADAKDFDDAISLDHAEGCLRLGVHIADVSSYVEPESSVDICARDRSTSVYLVDRVIPMLPEKLCEDVCSLRPGQERRTMTCDMFLDDDGRIVRYEIYPSVIRSRRRYTYGEVQDILDGRLNDPNAPKLKRFHALAQQLVQAREKRGALDFDSVEARPILDEDGQVTDVELRVKTDATSMIEEAMILANETVAAHLRKLGRPCVYRVHESPRPASLEALLPVLKELGYPISGLGAGEPASYQSVLQRAKGRPEQALVDHMMLRSMERARYSVDCQQHFGLASDCYCHFTSPIRRYPDLMVHRLLKDAHAMEGQLESIASHASRMERLAEEAEMDSRMLKLCEHMEGRIGEVFEGTISTVVARGFFVRLDNTLEGMVRFDRVHDEHHEFDPKLQVLVGQETGRSYKLGQRIRVRLDQVQVNERQVDFSLEG